MKAVASDARKEKIMEENTPKTRKVGEKDTGVQPHRHSSINRKGARSWLRAAGLFDRREIRTLTLKGGMEDTGCKQGEGDNFLYHLGGRKKPQLRYRKGPGNYGDSKRCPGRGREGKNKDSGFGKKP